VRTSRPLNWHNAQQKLCCIRQEAAMLTDRVRILLLSLLLSLVAACGGGGGNPGTPGNQIPPTPPPPAVPPGIMILSISGLPTSVPAIVRLTGPGNFSLDVPESRTIVNLAPGTYTVTAFSTLSGGITYNPAPTTQNVTVSSNDTVTAIVAYTSSVQGG
jgi:hypothetical protein